MRDTGTVAIVDYGIGNLFSVQHACRHVGIDAVVTSSSHAIASASAVILPGVGAFGDAMAELRRLDLVGVLRDIAHSGRPFLGICLGMQLLMRESHEFGQHEGLGLVPGVVDGFSDAGGERRLKIPQVGWNQIYATGARPAGWKGTLLEGLPDGVYMHFVHSYYVRPDEPTWTIAETEYGGIRFCSALQWNNIFACQAHPERSGPLGLAVYRNLASTLQSVR
jgi:glutamine amidotransferase